MYRLNTLEAIEFIYDEFYSGPRRLGRQDNAFTTKISGPFVCLICTVLHHCLEAWETGEYITPDDFNYANSGGEL